MGKPIKRAVVSSNATTEPVVESTPAQDTQEKAPTPEVENLGASDVTTDEAAVEMLAPEVEQAAETPLETVAPVVEAKVEAPKVVEGSNFADVIAALKLTGTPQIRAVISSTELYISRMTPGAPIDPDAGNKAQVSFWTMIRNLINRTEDPVIFNQAWSLLLSYFEEYKNGALSFIMTCRFTTHWTGTDDEQEAYLRILNLINLTSNPKTRQMSLNEVDMEKTLSLVFTEQGRQRILSFYKR